MRSLRVLVSFATVIVLAAATVLNAHASEKKSDPHYGYMTYVVPGTDSPFFDADYAEVFFYYSVDCQDTGPAALKAIADARDALWKDIVTKVPDSVYTELERKYWRNPTSKSRPTAPIVEPKPVKGKPVATKATRYNACTQKEVALDAKVDDVFTGSQRIGIRTSDMGWVENKVKEINKAKTNKDPKAVKVVASTIDYRITLERNEAEARQLRVQARDLATGKDSDFELDAKDLKFESATPFREGVASELPYLPTIGDPISSDQPPKVTMKLPFHYKLYAKAKDKIKAGKKGPDTSTFNAEAEATRDADYGTVGVTLTTVCHETGDGATAAMQPIADDVTQTFHTVQKSKAYTETDKIEVQTASTPEPQGEQAARPVEWNESGQVTAYLDTCTSKKFAVDPTTPVDLPVYYSTTQYLEIRSSNFKDLYKLITDLQGSFGKKEDAGNPARVKADISSEGGVTERTKYAIFSDARRSVAKCVLDPKGEVKSAIDGNGFTKACLVELAPGEAKPDNGGPGGGVPSSARGMVLEAAAAPMPADAPATRPTETVKVAGSDRPKVRFTGIVYYAFTFKFKTADYVEAFKEQK